MRFVSDYKGLNVWQKSMELSVLVYELTKQFPSDEKYGLVSQIRKSAVSVPSNIAEGSRRYSYKDFIKFIRIALGSLSELETQILISNKIGILSEEDSLKIQEMVDIIGKMLMKLQLSLKEKLGQSE